MEKNKNDKLLLKLVKKYKAADCKTSSEKIMKDISSVTVLDTKISIAQIRDVLLSIGSIIEEDMGGNSYAVEIKAGVTNANVALVLITLDETTLYLSAYAREGLIKQHTAEKAIQKINRVLKKYY